jgi:hypothetical protein
MAIDNNESLRKIKSKINAIKTVKKDKDQQRKNKKKKLLEKLDKDKKEAVKQLKQFEKEVKKQASDLFEELIEIFTQTKEDVQDAYKDTKKEFNKKKDDFKNRRKESRKNFIKKLDPTSGDTLSTKVQSDINYFKTTNTYRGLGNILFLTIQNTKARIKNSLIEDIISTIGCSEEQSYDNMVNTPIYIKVKNIDLFNILKTSPDDEYGKLNYEKEDSENGDVPYAMNRQLFRRLSTYQSFSQQYGQSFIGASGQELFDLQYVDNYIDQNNIQQFGDFFKVTLKGQLNNKTKVSDFLNDYFESIDVFNLPSVMNISLSQIFGGLNIGIKSSDEEIKALTKFQKVVKRLMGACTDPTQKIDVSGTAKLSDLDIIDDSFFDVTNLEDVNIEQTVNRKINGLVTFEGCETVNLPVNTQATAEIVNNIINENNVVSQINLFFAGIEELTADQNWQSSGFGLDLNLSLNLDIIKNLPIALFRAILSPKVLLGFLVMIKSLITNTLEFEDLSDFLIKFKKFVLKFTRNIIAIFIEELATQIKKNIKQLITSVIKDIKSELLDKQTKMYVTILEALLITGKGVLDYRECKPVIDDILQLLNLII